MLKIDEVKQNLESALRGEIEFALGNIESLSENIPSVDAYKLTATSFRLITNLMQIYSELIVEMIASVYNYSIVSFFVLDTKFLVWKAWLEAITALFRFYIVDPSINGKLRQIVLDLTDKASEVYTDLLQEKKSLYKEQDILIDYFLKIHKQTYDVFRSRLADKLSQTPVSDLDAINQLQNIAFEIAMWMQYTTFEVISLDRCLFGDKKLIVSGIVVTVYQETGLNLVDQFIQAGITDFEIQFTTPDLLEYKPILLKHTHEVA